MTSLKVAQTLAQKGLTITFAESMTGGLATYELIAHPGASDVIKGSIIAYSNDQKMKLLGLKEVDILRYGVVSKEVADLMANSIKSMMKSNIGVGITGNAGPTLQASSKQKEVFIAIKTDLGYHDAHLSFDHESRTEAIRKTVDHLYQMLDEIL